MFLQATSLFAFTECKKPISLITKTQVDWPTAPLGGYTLDENSSLADLVGYFFGWGVGLGGLAVFIALIIAGIQLITSVADPGKMNEAKGRIKSAVIGLALLLSSWAIFSLINPNLTEMEVSLYEAKGLKIEGKTCSDASECCDVVADPQCIPKNWRCCRHNDAECIETGVDTKATPGLLTIGVGCWGDHGCKEFYCGCNYGINPADGTEDDWKKVCLPNPKICIENVAAPELGCDRIVFYSLIKLEGDESNSSQTFIVEGDKINGGWIWFPPGFQPRSYQAFYNKKDSAGKETGKFLPCGKFACGCQINRCLASGQGAGGTNCITDTANKETGEFMEYVYSEASFEEIPGVRIKDSTKSASMRGEDIPWWKRLLK